MKLTLMLTGTALLFLMMGACQFPKEGEKKYQTDRHMICSDFEEKSPANLIILPVEGVDALDFSGKKNLREMFYRTFLDKGYAPLSLDFTDQILRELGNYHTPLTTQKSWNIKSFKEDYSSYCDAIAFVSIERYHESGQPSTFGIDIWGKIGLFDTKTKALLAEYYSRQTLHPTDPGGGRERFIQKALQEFADLLMGPFPSKESSKKEDENAG